MTENDLLKTMTEIINRPRVVACVMSREMHNYVNTHVLEPSWLVVAPMNALMGAPIYSFVDVPKYDCVIFFDQDALNRYATMRNQTGHVAAMMRLQAEVDGGLIQIATLRALLEPS